MLRLAAIGVLCGVAALAAAVVAVGLFLSAPARATVGAPPASLRAEPVEIASASGATLRGVKSGIGTAPASPVADTRAKPSRGNELDTWSIDRLFSRR